MDTFACMQMLFGGLPDSMGELIRLCEGQNALFSMFMLQVLSQISEGLAENSHEHQANQQKQQQSQPKKSLAGSFWKQLIRRSMLDTRNVLRRQAVRGICDTFNFVTLDFCYVFSFRIL